MNHFFRACRVLLAFLILSSAGVAMAQLDTGSIQGAVRDTTGAVIPNVSVIVTNDGTQRAYHTVSDREGEFNVPTLPAGTYSASASYKGFDTSKVSASRSTRPNSIAPTSSSSPATKPYISPSRPTRFRSIHWAPTLAPRSMRSASPIFPSTAAISPICSHSCPAR